MTLKLNKHWLYKLIWASLNIVILFIFFGITNGSNLIVSNNNSFTIFNDTTIYNSLSFVDDFFTAGSSWVVLIKNLIILNTFFTITYMIYSMFYKIATSFKRG